MKNYITISISMDNSSAVISKLDNAILKETAFTAKYKQGKQVIYENILLELIDYNTFDEGFVLNYAPFMATLDVSNPLHMDACIQYTIYSKLKDILPIVKNLSVFITSDLISDKDVVVFYSDGSCDKASGQASYSCCKLLEESEDGVYDSFMDKNFSYSACSGKLPGTNNIGELSGIKACLEQAPQNRYQIIISDSEYGLKSLREWIYNWKNNNYKNASGKTIENKELIMYIENLQMRSPAIFTLYKWTKGHNKNNFNEICDRLAKNELGK